TQTQTGKISLCALLGLLTGSVRGELRYSIPEEMVKGSFVGNIEQDLGLDHKRLVAGRTRIVTRGSNQYFELNIQTGILVVKEKIDRESLCGQIPLCTLSFEIILENPIELHPVAVEILDINDNAPTFPVKEVKLEISESSLPGSRFLLESADDPDVGVNALQSYTLKPLDYFNLKLQNRADGSKYVEMVLQTPLDREKQEELSLVLTAADGGNPQKSGTLKINIVVLDANDNPPVFTQSLYRASVFEDAIKGTLVTTVTATDADKGSNGRVTYFLSRITDNALDLFQLEQNTGKITVAGSLDFEKTKHYEINVQAKDDGGLIDSSKVIIEVKDINDNIPVIDVMSFSGTVSENVEVGTTVAVINVEDADSGRNGQIQCAINQNVPFKIQSSLAKYYSIVTDSVLDRESISMYNITITARDQGSPPLSNTRVILLNISDVNDNAPIFEKNSYSAYVIENNTPGLSVFSLQAKDSDWNQNARISYLLVESNLDGVPVSSYISVNSESGAIYAVRSFDYEQIKEFHIQVKAQDGGSPPLSNKVTVKIFVLDQNDNAPQILYPVHTDGSLVAEMVPRSADVGYLVTKVVAVDADSGQNAWLSYKLLKATDRALFEVGLQNGEIRTLRQVTDKDAVKQRLVVVVEDNGQPSRSATVNVNVAVADSFPEVLSEFTDFSQDSNGNLTFYLVLALAAVSFLFIISIVILLALKFYRRRQKEMKPGSFVGDIVNDLGTDGVRRTLIIKSSIKNYYTLITDGTLDREHVSEYNITITATDEGTPPLSSNTTLTLKISDVNDNAPVFDQGSYSAFIVENNTPGLSVLSLKAKDADWNQNARISYLLEDELINGTPVASLISVNSESGVVYTVRSFDYEQIKSIEIKVIARDGGSPPLISKAAVNIFVQDQNDNSPQILYPVHTDGSLVAEMVPRSADVGYLVTKVVAVDADSGQNAWLSYKLLKATDRALFEVGLQNGEIRTLRQVTDKDAVKQRLVVVVEDNGQPSRSATVNVNVAVADSFPEVLSEFGDFSQDKDYNDNLTFYLILSLSLVSFLFMASIIVIISLKFYRWRQSRFLYKSNVTLPVIPSAYYPPRYADVGGTGTLQHVYNYEVCLTTDSGKSEYRFIRPVSQNLVSVDP
uniref:Cadherin domain-containing protein n=1 Tax=Lepisosteus oculatus TaxID=7918 RepID=W5MZQ1_LEPOC